MADNTRDDIEPSWRDRGEVDTHTWTSNTNTYGIVVIPFATTISYKQTNK